MTAEREPRLSLPAPRRRRIGIRPAAAGLGLLGGLISFLGSWNPSFWGDEAASVMSAERPLGTLWRELGRIDAVHGAYYLFLHFWIRLFGASELSVRLPSAIAIGLAVAGIVVLADLILTRRIAVIAGIVFAVLPRVTLMGAEGRSYAMATALAVWLTVLFVVLLRRHSTRVLPWLAYGALLALSTYLFLYLVLLAGVHLLVMLSTRPNRMLLRHWLLAVAVAVVLSAPILVYGIAQHHQIAFLAKRNYATFPSVAVSQWFDNPWLAIAAWSLIVVGAVTMLRRHRGAAVLTLGWLALPTAILLVGNAAITPMYNLRYVSFSTPAVAILIAVGVCALARNWMRALAIAVLIGLAAPSYLAQREPYAKGGADFRQAAQLIAAHASTGDAVVFDGTVKPSIKPRLALRLYPQDFAGLKDVTLRTPYQDRSGIWDSVNPITAAELGDIRTVWALGVPSVGTLADVTRLQTLGYTVTRKFPVNRTTIYEMTRGAP